MDSLRAAFSNHTFLFFFAVVGIPVLCVTFRETIKLLIKHRERMAMIEHGMDPDANYRRPQPVEKIPAEPAELSK